jgi:hypothetical protein
MIAGQAAVTRQEMAGGGFVTGIVFKRREPGLMYARTDIVRSDDAGRTWIASTTTNTRTPGPATP